MTGANLAGIMPKPSHRFETRQAALEGGDR